MAETKDTQVNLSQLIQVRHDKLKALQDDGRDPFHNTEFDVDNYSVDIVDNFDELEGSEASIAGRMMAKRLMGKASFLTFRMQRAKSRFMLSVI